MKKTPTSSIAMEVLSCRDRNAYVVRVLKETKSTNLQLATAIGVHDSTVYLWATGKRPVPTPAMIAMETYRRGLLHLTPSTESV